MTRKIMKLSTYFIIQVDKVKLEEIRFVKLFANIFVTHALEVDMNANNIKSLFKDPTDYLSGKVSPPKLKCETCER